MLKLLVFPCGSEVALEIFRSLHYSCHVELFGASSVDDHGKFLFENYFGSLPFVDSPDLIPVLKKIIADNNIDAIYPAMDQVIATLKKHELELGCKVISSITETTEVCLSKRKTYHILQDVIQVPHIYETLSEVLEYPVFFKPAIGYGSRGIFLAQSAKEAKSFMLDSKNNQTDILITEYLPGDEYTVDCFTDRHRNLLFAGPRKRNRVTNGISVNTTPVVENPERFTKIADKINATLELRGAWFFQVKENKVGELVLLEVAARLGGSSSLFRNLGVNFAMLSVFDAFDYNVEVIFNNYPIELDRALSNSYKINFEYDEVYVDFDDCMIVRGRVNEKLVAFLYQCLNDGKRLNLITKHIYVITDTLKKYRLEGLFDEIIHIQKEDHKYKYIRSERAIFIDDSFEERRMMRKQKNIPVFAPDMLESLLKF